MKCVVFQTINMNFTSTDINKTCSCPHYFAAEVKGHMFNTLYIAL